MHSNQLKISIVVPTYNRGYIIQKALQSIFAQTFQDFEVIIVDDGSTDGTEQLLRSKWTDPRIRYLKHDKNRGLAAALNTGYRAARADFLAELSTDDVWDTQFLEKAYQRLNDAFESVGAVYAGFSKALISGKEMYVPDDAVRVKEGRIHEELLKGNFMTLQSMLLRKQAFEVVNGFDELLLALQDWDFFLRLSRKFDVLYIPEKLAEVRLLKDSITSNQKKRLFYREMIFKKHLDDFKKYPTWFAKHAYAIGHAYMLREDHIKGKQYLYMAFQYAPSKLKYAAAYVLSRLVSARMYKKIARFRAA